jgi:hypothetical protein
MTIAILKKPIELGTKKLKTSLVNLMSYSSAPFIWARDNLGIGGSQHFVWSQFG